MNQLDPFFQASEERSDSWQAEDVEAQKRELEYYNRQKEQRELADVAPPSEAAIRLSVPGNGSNPTETIKKQNSGIHEQMSIKLKRGEDDVGEEAHDLARLLFGGFPKRRSLLSIFDYSMLHDWGLFGDFFNGWKQPSRAKPVMAGTRRREYDTPFSFNQEPSAPPLDLQWDAVPVNDVPDVKPDFVDSLPRNLEPEQIKDTTETLTSALEAQGYAGIDVGGGGDCLFRALAHQALGTENSHYDLRQLIAEEIENNRELYEQDIIALEESETAIPHDFPDFKSVIVDRYLHRIRTMGKIGDAICIGAFTRLFDCDVVVFLHDKQRGLSSIVFEWPGQGKGERVVRHIAWIPSGSSDEANNHYISVVPMLAA